ncbi:elongation factor P [Alteraurantiacibacter aquimixticola]|uniref:Elongation factor P n=1 Tax=Alteraurantiacibacter aquimixticola TaxID=2489173 RepID=A0A4T3F3W3_9SPHN|nr:elongation factor P [Alteraurantiacibacter aquimixticola]TIX50208.1 elongation factor P [Alteraurantiacibacter aquimixticola]
MTRFALAPLALLVAAPAMAQGQIGTIERGQYICELPGDAGSQVGVEQPHENFRIASASRYVTEEGSGTYLRRGDVVTMTSGPRNGQQYAVISTGFLRKIENGEPGRLRCYRRGR